ncbi:uncharacterized protein LOC117182920 [Belonocnema kinseyi]|uniref:uncharacterized protein LOC117182920 n=1 Tax=Belonocnema kinseyi TaxID=2817044 RepID=UPI00143D7519|nr:uncharacterized protein LOC117182920 [Belonocnema kinseyi]
MEVGNRIRREEVDAAINRLMRNNATGADGMENEVLKYEGEGVREGIFVKWIRIWASTDHLKICQNIFATVTIITYTDSCYEAYKQGPCPPGEYLVLSPGQDLAKCERNDCLVDGFIPFKGSCLQLYNSCGDVEYTKFLYLGLDFQLTCIEPSSGSSSGVINAPIKKCSKGSRRNALGICKLVLT